MCSRCCRASTRRRCSRWLVRGMHAVHAVIEADDVVRLLGPLRSAGATVLLVLPIEHLIP